MAITRTPIIDDDGTGTTGTVIDNAWKTELYNQIDGTTGGGGWTNVAFNVANFWPGVTAANVPINCYTVIGMTMFWIVQIAGAPAPAPPSAYLYCTIPAGRLLFNSTAVLCPTANAYDDIAGSVPAYVMAGNIATAAVTKTSGAGWSGTVHAYFTAILGLQ